MFDQLTRDLEHEIARIVLIDPHSHIDPRRPTARNLDDILGYHYYTELAHFRRHGSKAHRRGSCRRAVRVRNILAHLDRIDNTVQYSWFVEIARTFLGFERDRESLRAIATICTTAPEKMMNNPGLGDPGSQTWQATSKPIFLTNDFDDPLEGFDTNRWLMFPACAPMISSSIWTRSR